MPGSQIYFCRHPMIDRHTFSIIGPATSHWSLGHWGILTIGGQSDQFKSHIKFYTTLGLDLLYYFSVGAQANPHQIVVGTIHLNPPAALHYSEDTRCSIHWPKSPEMSDCRPIVRNCPAGAVCQIFSVSSDGDRRRFVQSDASVGGWMICDPGVYHSMTCISWR